MRFLLEPRFHKEMQDRAEWLPPDCYVRPGEYLHHLYLEGVKYVVVPALIKCLEEAKAKEDADAFAHLDLHKSQLDRLVTRVQQAGKKVEGPLLGDPPPAAGEGHSMPPNTFFPNAPADLKGTGLHPTLMSEMILRCCYNFGRPTAGEIAVDLGLPYPVIAPLLTEMRQAEILAVPGQRGPSDLGAEYEVRPPKGTRAVEDALRKTQYSGPAPIPFKTYLESIEAQTVRNLVVTRRSITSAFQDLIIDDKTLSEIGPAVNSAASIFFFGYPGNGKTSIAERISRLMGDEMFVPHAIEVDGQIIKIYDRVVHELSDDPSRASYDRRWVKIKRPMVVVGGELTLSMLDLVFNEVGKFYEAPLQMKANGGVFLIDDFGRQQIRALDLLNRWIVPLEKKYDYLTTITGRKIQIPFAQLLIFSTNLDPQQLADEAFLRRIKFKIEIRDPDEAQWRRIWSLVCEKRKIDLDPKSLDYMLDKWFRADNRNLRMCQPRDILEKMICIAKYGMERVTMNPDLIDAACATYFLAKEAKDFGAKVTLH